MQVKKKKNILLIPVSLSILIRQYLWGLLKQYSRNLSKLNHFWKKCFKSWSLYPEQPKVIFFKKKNFFEFIFFIHSFFFVLEGFFVLNDHCNFVQLLKLDPKKKSAEFLYRPDFQNLNFDRDSSLLFSIFRNQFFFKKKETNSFNNKQPISNYQLIQRRFLEKLWIMWLKEKKNWWSIMQWRLSIHLLHHVFYLEKKIPHFNFLLFRFLNFGKKWFH